MTMNEMINSIDKANYESMKMSIDTCYSTKKSEIMNCISEHNRNIETCKLKIANATAKSDFVVNVMDILNSTYLNFQEIKNLNEQLEILEKAYTTIKID